MQKMNWSWQAQEWSPFAYDEVQKKKGEACSKVLW